MENIIDIKIKESQDILKAIGLPEKQQNKIAALTFLALCNLKPNDNWANAHKRSMSITKDIMEFVNAFYEADYKPNTRESFRKQALKPFVDNNIALLNPDDPSLSTTSANTHYAISDLALETIKLYKTNNWDAGIKNFKKNQFPENTPNDIFLKKLSIKNYKSIIDDTIELGRFNVFIGANGCGKSNILESVAMISAAKGHDLNLDGFYSRGIRMARPNLISSSFLNTPKAEKIDIRLEFENRGKMEYCHSILSPANPSDTYTKWVDEIDDLATEKHLSELVQKLVFEAYEGNGKVLSNERLFDLVNNKLKELNFQDPVATEFDRFLSDYAIFDLNTKSLRGITPIDSRKTPLGINGEGLDLLIANFNSYERSYLKKCEIFFDWLGNIVSDKEDKNKLEGLKPGRSTSTLYFTDKFMQKQNNTLSAENSNEGILHVLFYLALFISNKTPALFAIDNIETALNPKLGQKLIIELAKLAKDRGKQVLITTHNPAILDGLNLLDDEQRLFVVRRNDEGHTITRRVKFRSDLSDKKYKLSEMWLKGLLGAVPQNF